MDAKSLEYTIPFQLTKTIRRSPYPAIDDQNPSLSADGKIIIITGGGTGIGAAAAEVWARAGAAGVVVVGRRLEKIEETAAKVGKIRGGKTQTLAVTADVTIDEDVKNVFVQTKQVFGRCADVVLANAGAVAEAPVGEQSTDGWWDLMAINIKGVYSMAHHFIKTQMNPKQPVGTFITTNSGLGGLVVPGMSGYGTSKLAAQRLVEFLDAEYPTLRSFTLFPGIVQTSLLVDTFSQYGHDHPDLTGMMCLYLSTPQADYLCGGLCSVNWDVNEMEEKKDLIVESKMLRLKWIPVLPASGGKGLE